MLPLEEFFEESLKHHHFTAGVHQLFAQDRLHRLGIDGPLEEERMRADFTQLHDRVLQPHVVHLFH